MDDMEYLERFMRAGYFFSGAFIGATRGFMVVVRHEPLHGATHEAAEDIRIFAPSWEAMIAKMRRMFPVSN
jgi:hypothetical protein